MYVSTISTFYPRPTSSTCDAAAYAVIYSLLAPFAPPNNTAFSHSQPTHGNVPTTVPLNLRPGLRGVQSHNGVFREIHSAWHLPLLICRGLSTMPAAWWGLRCALTFLGELLLSDGAGLLSGTWEVEKRFRVTEVFLAILWVGPTLPQGLDEDRADRGIES